MSSARWWSVAFVTLSVGLGAGMLLQSQSASALRTEITLRREENQKLGRLRAEYLELLRAQPSDAELQRLRSDHAAVLRLRAEINALKARADAMARQQTAVSP
ncbi:MAG: hypothetical protein Q7S40_08890 [Opitutaceae bacterium]|nr:hypothetical protein [Opitutaceae bacterium]